MLMSCNVTHVTYACKHMAFLLLLMWARQCILFYWPLLILLRQHIYSCPLMSLCSSVILNSQTSNHFYQE